MNVKRLFAVILLLSLGLCSCGKNSINPTVPEQSQEAGSNSQMWDDDASQNNAQTEPARSTNNEERTDFEKLFRDGPLYARENDLYGYIDQSGDYVIEPQFSEARAFSDGVAFVKTTAQLWGLIDESGDYLSEPSFCSAGDFSDNGLAYVQDKNTGAYGYIDRTGAYQIEPSFAEAEEFIGDMAIVTIEYHMDGNEYGYINTSGKIVIDGDFEEAKPFSNNLAAVKQDGLWRYIDRSGEIVIDGGFEEAKPFNDNLAAVKQDGLWGYINRSGDFVISPAFEEADSFNQGIAFARYPGDEGYCLVNTDGAITPLNPMYFPKDNIWVADLCCVEVRADESAPELTSGCIYIDKEGNKALPKEGTYYKNSYGSFKESGSDGKAYATVGDPESGLMGFIDEDGEWVVLPQYHGDYILYDIPAVGIVGLAGNRQYVDMSGNVLAEVKEPIYFNFTRTIKNLDIIPARNGTEYGMDTRYGYVYPDGSIALDFIYELVGSFSSDGSYAIVMLDGDYGMIGPDGNYLIPAKFQIIQGVYGIY